MSLQSISTIITDNSHNLSEDILELSLKNSSDLEKDIVSDLSIGTSSDSDDNKLVEFSSLEDGENGTINLSNYLSPFEDNFKDNSSTSTSNASTSSLSLSFPNSQVKSSNFQKFFKQNNNTNNNNDNFHPNSSNIQTEKSLTYSTTSITSTHPNISNNFNVNSHSNSSYQTPKPQVWFSEQRQISNVETILNSQYYQTAVPSTRVPPQNNQSFSPNYTNSFMVQNTHSFQSNQGVNNRINFGLSLQNTQLSNRSNYYENSNFSSNLSPNSNIWSPSNNFNSFSPVSPYTNKSPQVNTSNSFSNSSIRNAKSQNQIPLDDFIYQVQFKRCSKNFIISPMLFNSNVTISPGDYVKVEADRGEDLGIVLNKIPFSSFEEVVPTAGYRGRGFSCGNTSEKKFVLRLATSEEKLSLQIKVSDEEIALKTIRERSFEKNLPMRVLDCEYQFDRHKLIFYFESNRRIDFRDLVSDLFSQYKTRIWMQQVDTITLPFYDPGTEVARMAGFLPENNDAHAFLYFENPNSLRCKPYIESNSSLSAYAPAFTTSFPQSQNQPHNNYSNFFHQANSGVGQFQLDENNSSFSKQSLQLTSRFI